MDSSGAGGVGSVGALDRWIAATTSSAFEGQRPLRITTFTDGTSNTILIVEGADAVPWTKPADLAFDPKKPLPRLGAMFQDVFLAALADGSVRTLKKTIKEDTLRALITRNGGEPVMLDD